MNWATDTQSLLCWDSKHFPLGPGLRIVVPSAHDGCEPQCHDTVAGPGQSTVAGAAHGRAQSNQFRGGDSTLGQHPAAGA